MRCYYCNRGMMYLTGDECVEVYTCVGCNSIAIKDIELNRNEYTWYKIEPLSSDAVLYDSLPGYDEIDQVANDEANGIDWDSLRYAGIYTDGFIAGALWMKNKIKK